MATTARSPHAGDKEKPSTVSGRIVGVSPQAKAARAKQKSKLNPDGTPQNLLLEFRGVDRARFKYLRFKCTDKTATHEFYTTLGMSAEWSAEQEVRTLTCYQFKTSSSKFNENSLWILFDWQKPQSPTASMSTIPPPLVRVPSRIDGQSLAPTNLLSRNPTAISGSAIRLAPLKPREPKDTREASSRELKVPGSMQLPPLPVQAPAERRKHESEYLVIYVHFLVRVVKRMETKGFFPKTPPTLHCDLSFAILTDPNGLEVRLIELSDAHLVSQPSKDWFARLGYYVLPTVHVDRVSEYYVAMFSVGRKEEKEDKAGIVPAAYKVGSGKARKKPGVKGEQREGFKIVDTEEVVMGLTRHIYQFASSATREDSCCLCFYEKMLENAHLDKPERSNGGDGPLIGVGFEVPNLEAAQTQLKKEFPEVLEFKQEYVNLKDVGFYSRFTCTHTSLLVELFSVHGRITKLTESKNPTLRERLGNRDPRVEFGYTLDYGRLGGMARALSEAAMVRVKREPELIGDRWGEDELAWEKWRQAEDEDAGMVRKRRVSR